MTKKINHTSLSIMYVCFMLVYMTIREILPLNFLIDSIIVSALVFIPGFILIAWDFFKSRKCFNGKSQDLLLLFVAVCIISSIINIKYGWFDNVKFLATILIEYLLFFTLCKNENKENIDKYLNIISTSFVITWFIPVFISILTYIFNIDIAVSGHGSWGFTNQGFSNEYMRLWGIFQDPNYASTTSLVSIFLSIRLISEHKNIASKLLVIINIFMQLAYILLGGSRAALILLFLSLSVFIIYSIITTHKQNKKGSIANISASLALVFVCVITIFATKKIIPNFQINDLAPPHFVSSMFENLYSLSDLEYIFLETTKEEAPTEPTPIESTTTPPTTVEYTEAEPSTQQTPDNTEQISTNSGTQAPTTNSETQAPTTNTTTTTSVSIDRADTNKTDISNGRFLRWKETIEVFKKAPLFGTSPRNLVPFARMNNTETIIAKFKIAPHNGYLDILVETGIVGFIVYAIAILFIVISFLIKYFSSKFSTTKIVLVMSICVLAGSAIFISDIFMLFSINSSLFWILMGFAYNYDTKPSNDGIFHKTCDKILGKNK